VAFAQQLWETLQYRESQVPAELDSGDSLSAVLTRDLLAVERAADTDMLTSILLLDGRRLRHGAAPNLPPAFCAAIDGAEIDPVAGSCGTAAYFGRPVYVVDIANDPLWADYRSLALAHGLRACWSTPILDDQGAVLGTFAIYHLEPRAPTFEEVSAIRAITDHVTRAIMWSKSSTNRALKLVTNDYGRIVAADQPGSKLLLDIAGKFDAIGLAIDAVIDALPPGDPCLLQLRRARKATLKGIAWARGVNPPDGTSS
jgi:GAF domain-containing protein